MPPRSSPAADDGDGRRLGVGRDDRPASRSVSIGPAAVTAFAFAALGSKMVTLINPALLRPVVLALLGLAIKDLVLPMPRRSRS